MTEKALIFPRITDQQSIRDIVAQGRSPYDVARLTFTAMQQIGRRIQGDFVDLAFFAFEVRRNASWTVLGLDSWDTFVNDLHIDCTPKQMSMLANMWEVFIEERGMPQEELARIGRSKAAYLLPPARKGPIDPEIWQAAQDVTCGELLIRLGHKPSERDGESNFPCPHCGVTIYGARYVGKKGEKP